MSKDLYDYGFIIVLILWCTMLTCEQRSLEDTLTSLTKTKFEMLQKKSEDVAIEDSLLIVIRKFSVLADIMKNRTIREDIEIPLIEKIR